MVGSGTAQLVDGCGPALLLGGCGTALFVDGCGTSLLLNGFGTALLKDPSPSGFGGLAPLGFVQLGPHLRCWFLDYNLLFRTQVY